MIQSFGDQGTKDIFIGRSSAKARKILPISLLKIACRKLDMMNVAHIINDLKAPPGNRLEALAGTLKGFYSIRINDQYRIVFKWSDSDLGPKDVQIMDYHR